MELHRLGPIWILVAHESGARIFSRFSPRSEVELREIIEHPIGRAKEQEILSDRPGREEEWGPSAGRHSFGKHLNATEKNALDFARELAMRLDRSRELNHYDYLILVAGPKFLGMLRQEIPSETSKRIVATLVQNLGNTNDRSIVEHIAPLLTEFDRGQGLKAAI